MMGILLRTLIIAFGIWAATAVVPGVSAATAVDLLWAAVALGLLNAFVRPLVVLFTLPLTVLTLGLFLLVINAAMLNLADWFVDGFTVEGFWSSIFGAVVVSLFSGLCAMFIGARGRYEVLIVRR